MNWYNFAAAILGYCLAAIFSSNVAFAFSLTVWGSVWTWIVLAFWWAVGSFLLVPVLAAIFFGAGAVGVGGLLGVAWIVDGIRRLRR